MNALVFILASVGLVVLVVAIAQYLRRSELECLASLREGETVASFIEQCSSAGVILSDEEMRKVYDTFQKLVSDEFACFPVHLEDRVDKLFGCANEDSVDLLNQLFTRTRRDPADCSNSWDPSGPTTVGEMVGFLAGAVLVREGGRGLRAERDSAENSDRVE